MSVEPMQGELHILTLEIENVKKLRAIRIHPDGSLVVVGGKNGQGKTSTLDAIEMALAGGRSIPQEPVRRGARKARIVVDLGELVVERTFTAKGTQLVVRGKDGVAKDGPQALLNKLYSEVTLDPLAFAHMDPKKQDETLKRILGLDFSELDREWQTLYEARRVENRVTKDLDARLRAMPPPRPGLPSDEVKVSDLITELTRLQAVVTQNEQARRGVAAKISNAKSLEKSVGEKRAEIMDLEAAINRLRNQLTELEDELNARETELEDEVTAAQELVDPDLDETRARIESAEDTNRHVRAAQQRVAVENQVAASEKKVRDYTNALGAIEEQKRDQLGAAKFPVPGLGFDESGVTLNGIPLAQASDAEKLRLSVAIAAALSPRLKVALVREGSRLDADGLKLLATLAAEQGLQVWLEKVSDDGAGCTVVLEDGMVRADVISAETIDAI